MFQNSKCENCCFQNIFCLIYHFSPGSFSSQTNILVSRKLLCKDIDVIESDIELYKEHELYIITLINVL